MTDAIARLSRMLEEDEVGAAKVLAGPLPLEPCESPHIVRCLEDIAMFRRFTDLVALGESKQYAIERTARDMDMNSETVKSRIRGLTRTHP